MKIKKLPFLFCLLFPSSAMWTIGCSSNIEPIDEPFNISIDGLNYGFSRNLINPVPYIFLSFNIDGKIKNGDKLLVYIKNQKVGPLESNNLDVGSDYKQINLTENQRKIDIEIKKLSFVPNSIFKETFSLEFKYLRAGQIISLKQIDNLYFYNATPITRDFLDIEKLDNDKIVLKGFKKDEGLREQLKHCNFLFIPDDITNINENAFFEEQASTIPRNNDWELFFGNNFGSDKYKGNLVEIGKNAFFNALSLKGDFNCIPTLSKIGETSFQGSGFNGTFLIQNRTNELSIGLKAFGNVKFRHFSSLTQSSVSIDTGAFSYSDLIDIIFEKNMENLSLYDSTFEYAPNLTSVILPATISNMGNRNFCRCSNLKTISFYSTHPYKSPTKVWGDNNFLEIASNGTIYLVDLLIKDEWTTWLGKQCESQQFDAWKIKQIQ